MNAETYRQILIWNLMEPDTEDQGVEWLEATNMAVLQDHDVDEHPPTKELIQTALRIAKEVTNITHHWPMLSNMHEGGIVVDYRPEDGRHAIVAVFIAPERPIHVCWSQDGVPVGAPGTSTCYQGADELLQSPWISETFARWNNAPCIRQVQHHYPEHATRVRTLLQAVSETRDRQLSISLDHETNVITITTNLPSEKSHDQLVAKLGRVDK